MNEWWDEIHEELELISEEEMRAYMPAMEVKQGDHEVGVLGTSTRKLLVLSTMHCNQLQALENDFLMLDECQQRERAKLLTKMNFLVLQLKVLQQFLFVSMCLSFPVLTDKNDIEICKDWKVVWRDEVERNTRPVPVLVRVIKEESEERPQNSPFASFRVH